jgi:Rho-binding antiterminator
MTYIPIRCDFHDELLVRAMRRRRCEIVYRTEAGEEVSVRDSIEDVYAKCGAEFMRLGSGVEIRLDRLIRVDDQFLAPSANA